MLRSLRQAHPSLSHGIALMVPFAMLSIVRPTVYLDLSDMPRVRRMTTLAAILT